jgi:hypothetical protein
MSTLFFHRLAGAAMLDATTYEEIEADGRALPQAFAVVLLSSLAAGIGARGAWGSAATLSFFALASVLALATWVAFALLTFHIGSRLLATPETHVDVGELLRTLGFAAAPGLLQVFALFSPWAVPICALAFAWTVVASVVAVRQSLDFTSTPRAIAVCLLAWALPLAMVAALGAIVSSATLRG